MPSVSEQMKRLSELFSGTWRGEEKLSPSDFDPKGGVAFGTWVVHASLDGHFLFVDYSEERDGKVVYRGHGVHGWNHEARAFNTFWFDNIGVVPQAPDKATLEGSTLSYTSPGMGGSQNRFRYAFAGDQLHFTIETSKDAGKSWAAMHDGRYTRQ